MLMYENIYFLNQIYIFIFREIIRSHRESLQDGLNIDNQKKHFELLVQNPKNLISKLR